MKSAVTYIQILTYYSSFWHNKNSTWHTKKRKLLHNPFTLLAFGFCRFVFGRKIRMDSGLKKSGRRLLPDFFKQCVPGFGFFWGKSVCQVYLKSGFPKGSCPIFPDSSTLKLDFFQTIERGVSSNYR